MTDVEKQEGQKTVVSFIAGLLIGGLLVWAFSGSPADEMVDKDINEDGSVMIDDNQDEDEMLPVTDDEAADVEEDEMQTSETGTGSVEVADQEASTSVALEGATFPTEEGWVGVRTYRDGEFLNILGVSRYSKSQGLIPETVELVTPMIAGSEYAVVFFSENGDRQFSPAVDVQLETELNTFVAK